MHSEVSGGRAPLATPPQQLNIRCMLTRMAIDAGVSWPYTGVQRTRVCGVTHQLTPVNEPARVSVDFRFN